MDENMDWSALVRFLNGDCSPEEEMEVINWMKEDPENEEYLLFLKELWHESPEEEKKPDIDSAWERFNREYDLGESEEAPDRIPDLAGRTRTDKPAQTGRNRKGNWIGIAAVAASLLLIVLVSQQFIVSEQSGDQHTIAGEIEYREIATDKGQRTKIILSDGSTVHLNGDSYLRMPEYFSGNGPKDVYLEGEAFFEITSDEKRPFRVLTDESITTVLGTRFNVRSYPEDTQVMVVVAEGKVSLDYIDQSAFQPVTLTRYQKGTIGNGSEPSVTEVSDLLIYHGWTQGELVFDQEPVTQMITRLERWFGIEVIVDDPVADLAGRKLTASFSERQPVEDVLQAVSLAMEISVVKSDTSDYTYKFYQN